jgi:hypothetical protein
LLLALLRLELVAQLAVSIENAMQSFSTMLVAGPPALARVRRAFASSSSMLSVETTRLRPRCLAA